MSRRSLGLRSHQQFDSVLVHLGSVWMSWLPGMVWAVSGDRSRSGDRFFRHLPYLSSRCHYILMTDTFRYFQTPVRKISRLLEYKCMCMMHQQLDKKSEVLEKFWISEKNLTPDLLIWNFWKVLISEIFSEIQNFSEAQNLSQVFQKFRSLVRLFSDIQIFCQVADVVNVLINIVSFKCV